MNPTMSDITIKEIEEIAALCEQYATCTLSEPEAGEGGLWGNTALSLRRLLAERQWRPIDGEAKNGKPHLFICRWEDQYGAEERIVLRWEIDGWFDWDSVKLNESIPVAYMPLPEPPAQEKEDA